MKKFAVLLAVSIVCASCGGERAAGTGGNEKNIPAPAMPGGMTTVAGNGIVTVRWNAAPNATGYNLYISPDAPTPLAEAEKIGGIKETSYEHKGLANNRLYFYRVSAVNGGVESEAGAPMAAKPREAVPAVPQGVAAFGGTGGVTVKWTPVEGADSYNVYYSTKPQQPNGRLSKVSVVKPPFEHKDVKKKNMYFYRVSAVNASGESPLSAESGATP